MNLGEYRSTIELLCECISGVKRADGSTIRSQQVTDAAFSALEFVLRDLEFSLGMKLGEFLGDAGFQSPDVVITSPNRIASL